ncbi:MAG: GDP-mannose 4,6-dehydratase, partial [Patescibacteria group bacterium]
MTKTALITGVTGQDGSHLSELLLKKGYKVFGIIRGQNNPKKTAFQSEFPQVKLIEADLTDKASLVRAIEISQPNEIYNLGAISHVGYSF